MMMRMVMSGGGCQAWWRCCRRNTGKMGEGGGPVGMGCDDSREIPDLGSSSGTDYSTGRMRTLR